VGDQVLFVEGVVKHFRSWEAGLTPPSLATSLGSARGSDRTPFVDYVVAEYTNPIPEWEINPRAATSSPQVAPQAMDIPDELRGGARLLCAAPRSPWVGPSLGQSSSHTSCSHSTHVHSTGRPLPRPVVLSGHVRWILGATVNGEYSHLEP